MTELTCNHCKHTWDYKGKAPYYTCCPSCHYNVPVASKKIASAEALA